MIGKRRDARYVSRRSPDWIKLKCGRRQEFVIGGFTDPQGARTGIGALLLGVHDDARRAALRRQCRHRASTHATLRSIAAQLETLRTDTSPFPPRAVPGRAHHWVKPVLVAEVEFCATGRVAAPCAMPCSRACARTSRPANIMREQALPVEDVAADDEPVAAAGQAACIAEDHQRRPRDRQVDAAPPRWTLVRYYALVGELMMVHLKGRPVSLVRAPEGVGGELFFQKHVDVRKMPGLQADLDQALDPEHPPMLEVATPLGILSAAQWNVVEIPHAERVGKGSYEKPNRMVFDLDPGEGVEWPEMQEAAQLMHAFLDELGLPAFLKTSGGKGLHVVVPIKGNHDWDTVKRFSQAIVHHMAQTLPERFAFKSGPKNRVGKIFIDYLRNGQGATTVCGMVGAHARGWAFPCRWPGTNWRR